MKPKEWYNGKGFPELLHEDVRYIVGHHSEASADQSPDDIEAFHMRPKVKPIDWPDHYDFKPGRGWRHVAYHRLITKDRNGKWKVFEGVPLSYQGIHCRGMNHRSISIMIAGDYEDQLPPAGALHLAVQLYVDLRLLLGTLPLIGHNQAARIADTESRSCPGASDWPERIMKLLPLPPDEPYEGRNPI
jgi:hypothetical protein